MYTAKQAKNSGSLVINENQISLATSHVLFISISDRLYIHICDLA